MAKPDVELDEVYRVGAGDVFLTLTIGEGQFGTSDVLLDKVRILRASGTIGSLRIGSGPDIAGQTLLVRSVVNDVSTKTNDMSITYALRGGRADGKFVAKGSVAAPGKLLIFEAAFLLEVTRDEDGARDAGVRRRGQRRRRRTGHGGSGRSPGADVARVRPPRGHAGVD